jgi:hypothetical protein
MFLTAKYVSAANVNVIPESDVAAVTPSGRNVYDHAMVPGDVCAIVNVCWVVVSSASCVGDTSTGFTAAVTVSATDTETPITFVAVTVTVVGAKLVPAANENVIPLSDVDTDAGISGEYDHDTAPVYGAVWPIVNAFAVSVSRFCAPGCTRTGVPAAFMENSRGADVRCVIPLDTTTGKTTGVEMIAPWATLSVMPVSD